MQLPNRRTASFFSFFFGGKRTIFCLCDELPLFSHPELLTFFHFFFLRFIVKSKRLMRVHYYIDWPTDSMLWRKHNFCQSLCASDAKAAPTGIMVSAEGQEATCCWLLTRGMDMENKVQVGRGGLSRLYFLYDRWFYVAWYACFVVWCLLVQVLFLFLLLYLFWSIHPLFLNVCEWKTHMGRKRERER